MQPQALFNLSTTGPNYGYAPSKMKTRKGLLGSLLFGLILVSCTSIAPPKQPTQLVDHSQNNCPLQQILFKQIQSVEGAEIANRVTHLFAADMAAIKTAVGDTMNPRDKVALVIKCMFNNFGYSTPDETNMDQWNTFTDRPINTPLYPLWQVMAERLGTCFDLSLVLALYLEDIGIQHVIFASGNHMFVRANVGDQWVNIETTGHGAWVPIERYYDKENPLLLFSVMIQDKEAYNLGSKYHRSNEYIVAEYVTRLINPDTLHDATLIARIEAAIKELHPQDFMAQYYKIRANAEPRLEDKKYWLKQGLAKNVEVDGDISRCLANVSFTEGNYEDALLYLIKSMQYNTFPFPNELALADLYFELNMYKQAIEHYNNTMKYLKYCSVNLSAWILSKRALALYFIREYDRAITDCRVVLKYDEGNYAALFTLAESLFAQGKYDEALMVNSRGIEIFQGTPDEISFLRGSGVCLRGLKRPWEGIDWLFRSLEIAKGGYKHGNYHTTSEVQVESSRKVLRYCKAEVIGQLKIKFQEENYEDVVDLASKYLTLVEEQDEMYYMRGLALNHKKQFQEALSDIENASRLNPNNPNYEMLKAEINNKLVPLKKQE
jgi:tetratricopeptide (TPR) repeat protein